MKKITKLFIGTAAFTFLFYNQSPGLNIAFVGLITWLLIFLKPAEKIKHGNFFWFLSVCVFFSACAFAWCGDVFSFLALFFSILILGIQSQYPRINVLLYPLLWLINYATFIFRFFSFKYWFPKRKADNNSWKKLIALVLIPAFFGLIFIALYSSGSDLFYSFFQQFTFNFNFFEVIFLSCLGFFLLFNLWFMLIPKAVIKLNSSLTQDFTANQQINFKPTFSFLEINFERKSGEMSLILLNILLLFFIVTYNYEQFFSIASKATLSDEIHQRVITIIISIIMAIAVIMFYFKSTFNFDKNAALLKKLSYIWILLNAVLIVSAFVKNTEYVSSLGLTYKRIGVYIFLTLSLIGLFVTYLKIKLKKTNSFLLNRMVKVFFITFILTSGINFSWIVTSYNISHHKNTDIEYLKSLSFNKQILFNTYKNDPGWQSYFANQKESIEWEKSKSFLSSTLYFSWLKIDK